ncbi:MAG: efflux RND transporter periplasmic adaptor subunit [Cyclobacteriaceae bacterium]|nr:efflux RND transporter periplasmic adaptor subunit [Cyclobacteriaceae bacterium]
MSHRSGLLLFLFLMMACTGSPRHEHDQAEATEVYTCPMHPEVTQPGPGKCPVCGMDLVKKASPTAANHGLMLTDSQIRLANITTRKVAQRKMGNSLLLNARLAANQETSEVVSSRTAGRIDRLYIKETGQPLRTGAAFLELYSENLLTLQKEYLLALDQAAAVDQRYEAFVASSRKKLIRFGLTEAQVDELKRTRATQERITFLAPVGGLVTEILVAEGQYVEEGTPLYRVEDIRRLWVEAELYPAEANAIRTGEKVEVNIPGITREPLSASVSFISPEYRDNAQVVILRATLDNPALAYRPGMPAEVVVRHSVRPAISVPADAVIRSSGNAHVFVLTDKNTFERRMVRVGLEDASYLEILSGLQEGDEVVVTGAYLLHSEMILKGIGSQTSHQH